jgi:hypothetical protein
MWHRRVASNHEGRRVTDKGPGRDGAGAPADPGRRTDLVASNHAGQRVPDKTDRTSTQNLYIDQALITNMVKAKEGRITRPDLIALFEVLNMGMRAEKIVCPRSWFHREEGSLTSLGTAIQRYLRFISQLDFEPPFELEKRQFFNAACAFLGRAPL